MGWFRNGGPNANLLSLVAQFNTGAINSCMTFRQTIQIGQYKFEFCPRTATGRRVGGATYELDVSVHPGAGAENAPIVKCELFCYKAGSNAM